MTLASTGFHHAWAPAPTGPLRLDGSKVHAWCVSLEPPPGCVEQLAQLLSEDERLKAERFHFDRDRRRSIVARGVLRLLLGRYLEVSAREIGFCYGSHGKPGLAEPFSTSGLEFNLAHSHEMAVYAFALERQVGIDVEYARPLSDLESLARHSFSPRETAVLLALPPAQHLEGFYNCWTRKEAYIKAIGLGLSQALDQFDVSLVPGQPARLLNIDGDPGQAAHWSLHALPPPEAGYPVALIAEGNDWHFKSWRYLFGTFTLTP
jgi:4'-phosphopantetheinyl transferase